MSFKENLMNIKIECSLIKPQFKLAHLQHKIEKEEKKYLKLQQEVEKWQKQTTLLPLENVYLLKQKDKSYIVEKKLFQLKEEFPIEEIGGQYTGYFKDVFTGNTICHFRQNIDYQKDNFTLHLLPNSWKDYKILPILDYIDINQIHEGQILISNLKELYLKLNNQKGNKINE